MLDQVPLSLPPFKIKEFSLWSPSAVSKEEWRSHIRNLEGALQPGDLPSVSFLPISLRKKLSPLTKVSCFLLNDLISKSNLDSTFIRLVLSSRFGEAENTIQLLRAIKDDEPTSPMAFSRSVHNSALGIFSIATHNKTLSSSVSGGKRTVSAGLVESVLQLYSSPDIKEVLYVHADEGMPEEYHQFATKPKVPFGFCCLIEKAESKVELRFREGEDEALEFISFLLGAQ